MVCFRYVIENTLYKGDDDDDDDNDNDNNNNNNNKYQPLTHRHYCITVYTKRCATIRCCVFLMQYTLPHFRPFSGRKTLLP